MKVAINASLVGVHAGGMETYVRNLIRGLATVDPDTDYTLLSPFPLQEDLIPGAEKMQRLVVASSRQRVRFPFALSRAVARAGFDVVHEQAMAPFLFGTPIVVTVHDLYFEHYPHGQPLSQLAKWRIFVSLTAHRAAVVLTDSHFSKQDIVARYHVSPNKIVVAHLAADPMFQPIYDEARLAAVRERYGTGDHFILATGSLKPNKNPKMLLDAYVRLRRADTIRHRLVFAGTRVPWLHDDTFAAIRTSGYEQDVAYTGYVPDEDLVLLYNAADLFVNPSLFEGFGLPPLEAMACGTPVVTSSVTSLPEVVGDAALIVNPMTAESLASAMAQVLQDPGLQAHLVRSGLQRASTFSWEATARIVAGAYRRAALGSQRHSRPT